MNGRTAGESGRRSELILVCFLFAEGSFLLTSSSSSLLSFASSPPAQDEEAAKLLGCSTQQTPQQGQLPAAAEAGAAPAPAPAFTEAEVRAFRVALEKMVQRGAFAAAAE